MSTNQLQLCERPLVSILINNHNYAQFLGPAIDSALSQTYPHVEVIVVDDGSTDSSLQVIHSYADRIIPVIKPNGGQASAFNAAFAASSGDILCFLDSDDLFLPHKLSAIVEIFQQRPEAQWCFDRLQEFDNDTGQLFPLDSLWQPGPLDARSVIKTTGSPPYLPTATSGLSFRRSALLPLLPMPEFIRITSDSYLKLAALGLQPGWMAAEQFTLQRIHGQNAYTRRRVGRRSSMALTGLAIGVGLYEQFPSLRRLAITTFSRGLGLSWIAGPHPHYGPFVAPFLRNLSLSTKTQIFAKATSCSVRTLLSDARRLRFLSAET
jgi:hypothetical protein